MLKTVMPMMMMMMMMVVMMMVVVVVMMDDADDDGDDDDDDDDDDEDDEQRLMPFTVPHIQSILFLQSETRSKPSHMSLACSSKAERRDCS